MYIVDLGPGEVGVGVTTVSGAEVSEARVWWLGTASAAFSTVREQAWPEPESSKKSTVCTSPAAPTTYTIIFTIY